MADLIIGKCPLGKEGCKGLQELTGSDAARVLGPFARPNAKAVVCAYHDNTSMSATVAWCESTVQGNIYLPDDAPVPSL